MMTTDVTTESDDPTERIVSRLDRLIVGVESGSAAVAAETAAREAALAEERQARAAQTRRTRWIIALVAGFFALSLAAASLVGWDRITRNETTCAEKLARADVADQRVLIGVTVVAGYAELTAEQRADLTTQVQDGFDKLPPPC